MARCDRRSLHALVDLVPGDTLGPDTVGVLRGEATCARPAPARRRADPRCHRPPSRGLRRRPRVGRRAPGPWLTSGWSLSFRPASAPSASRQGPPAAGEQSLVAHLIGALQSVEDLDDVVLAVPQGEDPLVTAGRALGVEVIEGAERDVLARYALATFRTEADAVVRVTVDCPLLDPDLVSLAVADYRRDPATT